MFGLQPPCNMHSQLSIQELQACPLPTVPRPTLSHLHAGGQSGSKPKLYNPRNPNPEKRIEKRTITDKPFEKAGS